MTIRKLLEACYELTEEQLNMDLGIVLLDDSSNGELYLKFTTCLLSEMGLSDLCDEDIPCIAVQL